MGSEPWNLFNQVINYCEMSKLRSGNLEGCNEHIESLGRPDSAPWISPDLNCWILFFLVLFLVLLFLFVDLLSGTFLVQFR